MGLSHEFFMHELHEFQVDIDFAKYRSTDTKELQLPYFLFLIPYFLFSSILHRFL